MERMKVYIRSNRLFGKSIDFEDGVMGATLQGNFLIIDHVNGSIVEDVSGANVEIIGKRVASSWKPHHAEPPQEE